MNYREWAVAGILIGIGCTTMVGDILGIRPLKVIGLASAASPAPKVFTAQDGFETYANLFFVEWYSGDGLLNTTELTPEKYAGLEGPYNRRNVFGAVVSYSPVLEANPLTRPMFRMVMQRSFCRENPIIEELGVPRAAIQNGVVRIRLVPRKKYDGGGFKLVHEVNCNA